MGALALRVLGWRLRGELPPVPKFVAIVAPHTSNLDFFVGVAVMFALDADVHFFAKDTLFLGPFGAALRALGGRPVRRQAPEGVVAEVAAAVRESPQFILALAPEGTRSRVADWRTGFYRIAEAAEIPILPVWLDWGRREAGLGALVHPTGDLAGDLARLRALYRPEMARHPNGFHSPDAVASA